MRYLLLTSALFFCAAEVQALEPDIRSDFFEMFLSQSADSSLFDPVGEAHPGLDTLYIWTLCTREVRTLEFAFTGTYEVVELIPFPGAENLGTAQEPYLVTIDPYYLLPDPVAAVIVNDSKGLGAELCFDESSSSGRLCFQISDRDTWFRAEYWRGFTTIGPDYCYGYGDSAGCTNIAVDSESWGELKARYR